MQRLDPIIALFFVSWPLFAVRQPATHLGNIPSSARMLLESAACRIPASNSSGASQLLKMVASHLSSSGYYKLGTLYVQKQNYACAAAAFQNPLNLDGTSWQARYSLGLSLAEEGKYSQASVELRKVVAQKSEFAKAHHALGSVLQSMGNRNGAAAEFERAIRLDPKLYYAYYDLAQALDSQKEYTAEIYYLRKALALNPPKRTASSLEMQLGTAYEHGKKKGSAIRALRKAVALSPKSVQTHYDLATMYARNFR